MPQEFIEKLPDNFKKDNNKFYVGIIGSRSIEDKETVLNLIDVFLKLVENELLIPKKDIIIVSGGAKGVDSYAVKFAKNNNIDYIVIKPNWKKYGKSAGFIRNTEIVKLSDIIFAIVDKPTGGSWDTIKKAQKQGKHVVIQKLY